MEAKFWESRWQSGQIGFHRDRPNQHLVTWGPRLFDWPGRGFLPLCGKSVDLPWLARQGVRPVGNELIRLAVEQFVAENAIDAAEAEQGHLHRHLVTVEGGEHPVELWQGDFFELMPEHVGPVDWVFDRAAMIALPPEQRGPYVRHLLKLAAHAKDILLVTFESADRKSGPPFAISPDEVREHYAGHDVERLEHHDVLDQYPPIRDSGTRSLWEAVWRVRLRSAGRGQEG